MLITIIKDLCSSDIKDNETHFFTQLGLLEDIVGGNVIEWFNNIARSRWDEISYSQRSQIIQKFVQHQLESSVDIVEEGDCESYKEYSVEIQVLEWNSYNVSLRATSKEQAARIAQSQGRFGHEDPMLHYESTLNESGVSAYKDSDSKENKIESVQEV